jgi:hypothetical protein
MEVLVSVARIFEFVAKERRIILIYEKSTGDKLSGLHQCFTEKKKFRVV